MLPHRTMDSLYSKKEFTELRLRKMVIKKVPLAKKYVRLIKFIHTEKKIYMDYSTLPIVIVEQINEALQSK